MLTQGDVGGLWLGTLLLQGPLVHISHPTSLEGRTYSIKATVIDRLIWMGLTDIFLYSHPFASSFLKLVWFYFSHFKGPPSSALPVSPSCLLFSPRREITWVMSDRLGADLHNRQIKIRSFPCHLCLSLKLLCPTRKKTKDPGCFESASDPICFIFPPCFTPDWKLTRFPFTRYYVVKKDVQDLQSMASP